MWAAPAASGEDDDGKELVGRFVWVRGWGEGKVQAFKTNPTGPSSHVVGFADLRRVETIKLDRKGNGQTPWLLRKVKHGAETGGGNAKAAGAVVPKLGAAAAAVAREWRSVSLVFVCSHLAAHQGHVAQRNESFHQIDEKMPLHPGKPSSPNHHLILIILTSSSPHLVTGSTNTPPPPGVAGKEPPTRLTDRFDCCVWLGDLNYRIEANRRVVDALLLKADRSAAMEALRANDQLLRQQALGEAFVGWSEGELNFLPTYKLNPGTDTFDTSKKARVPAWTDRILCKHGGDLKNSTGGGSEEGFPGAVAKAADLLPIHENPAGVGLRLLGYDSVPSLKVSDHRAVRAAYALRLPQGAEQFVRKGLEVAGVGAGSLPGALCL